MRYSKYLIVLLIAVFPAKLFAQDITGLWKGTLYNDTTKKYYRYEIGISEEKGKLSGFSHTFFLVNDKEFYGVKKVKIKKVDGKIIVEDAGLIANNYPEAPAKGVRQLNVLTLEIKDSIMTLSGPFSTNRTKEYSSLTGTISLQRKNDFWQSALVPHLQELGLSTELSFVKNEIEKEKEEVDKIAAKQAITAGNNPVAVQKEKAVVEDPAVKKETKAEVVPSKEITSNKATSKADDKKEVNKELDPATSKEVAINNEPVNKETRTGAKIPDGATSNKVIPKAADKEALAKEIKPTGSKPETTTDVTVKATDTKAAEIKETKSIPVAAKAEAKSEVRIAEQVKEIKPVSIVPVAAAEVANRKNIVQQTVYFSSDSLQLSLYDNGEVDGDTVSVLMNGNIIMAKEGLSTNAVRKSIYVGHDVDSIELIMYAENLGSIAPNTGLLVVHDGKSIYEIRFSGDLKKNASIILRRRKN